MTAFTSRIRKTGYPQGAVDADSHSSIIDGSRGRDAQWQWYHGCIRRMFQQAGCPEGDLDDAAHDFIVEKLDRVFLLYDRRKGRFRSYLACSVSNSWRDRQRSARAKDARHQELGQAEVATPEAAPAESGTADLTVLNVFFDRLFARFMREMSKAQVGFVLLRDWCQSGRDVEESITANHLELSAGYARKARAEAIKAFATFVEGRLCDEDYALMVDEARSRGEELGFVANARSIAGVFRWPSEKKRLGTVALLLRHLYLKYQGEDGGFDGI
jgi:DNA-directed RNA polymerase specialized sigma24 family protein